MIRLLAFLFVWMCDINHLQWTKITTSTVTAERHNINSSPVWGRLQGLRGGGASIFGFRSNPESSSKSSNDGRASPNERHPQKKYNEIRNPVQSQVVLSSQRPPPPQKTTSELENYSNEQERTGGGDNFSPVQQRQLTDQSSSEATSNGLLYPPPPPPTWNEMQSYQQQSVDWMDTRAASSSYPSTEERSLFLLQQDLDASLFREHELAIHMRNISNSLAILQQREEVHLRKLDLLTDRVIEVEARAASEHNQMLEAQANNSALNLKIVQMKGEIQHWKERFLEMEERNKDQQVEKENLVQNLEKARREAENFAARVERFRLDQLQEQQKYQKSSFSWWGNKDDGDDLSKLQQDAKATLLKALNRGRRKVEALETTVTNLEKEKSVMTLQVQSKDERIDELDERLALLEDEKVVLKAALKQLQKEMAEDKVKKQSLVKDLEASQLQVKHWQKETEALKAANQAKVQSLQATISQKQAQIAQVEFNLTAINQYAEKLEERLSTFAVHRKDMEKREEEVLVIQERAKTLEEESTLLHEKFQQLEKEHEDLKMLLEQLVMDRTDLQRRFVKMSQDKNQADAEIKELRHTLQSLQVAVAEAQAKQQQQQQQQLQDAEQVHQLGQKQLFPPPPPRRDHPAGAPPEQENQMDFLINENSGLGDDIDQAADLQHEVDESMLAQHDLPAVHDEYNAANPPLANDQVANPTE